MTKTWCVDTKHFSKTNNKIEFEKVSPKTQKVVKISKGICSICGSAKSQTFY